MPAPSLCLITGVAYRPDGAIAPGARLTLLGLVKNATVISSGDEVFTADALGAFSFSLIRGSVATLRGNIEGFNAIHGASVAIPDAASATLESLVPATTSTATLAFNFIGLADAPQTYVGQAGLIPRVKTDESGLEFVTVPGGTTYTDEDAQDAISLIVSTVPPYRWSYVHGLSLELAIDPATSVTEGLMSAEDKTKLDGIATGATANSSDATLLARANHTGVMPDGGFPATLPAASGINLTALNASNIASGALAKARQHAATAYTDAANTFAGQTVGSLNGAASTPPLTLTGSWFTGGSGTTTKPQLLIEPSTATSTGWQTSGTGLGVNAASGFGGYLLDLQLNGVNKFFVNASGDVSSVGSVTGSTAVITGSTAYLRVSTRLNLSASADGRALLQNSTINGLQTLALGGAVPTPIGAAPAQGQTLTILQCAELLTIAAAATTTTTMQVPAGAIVLSVSVRVTTVIPTAATFTVKIGAQTFNTAAVSTAATSTDPGTAAGAFYNATAGGVIITPNLTPGAGTGVVRITVSYIQVTPPTS